MTRRASPFLSAIVLGCALVVPALGGPPSGRADQRDAAARGILSRACFSCHGPDSAPPRAGLRLDTAADRLRGGRSGPAVVPGDPGASLLVRALRGQGVVRMPPGRPLPAAELVALEEWVKSGARDAANAGDGRHWSFRPLGRPSLPAVRDARVVRTPIDRFILARLEASDLRLSPEADRRTLIRRLSFDLIGLPPTPEEIDAFLGDGRPDAVERLVDRLLASPHYGERWGRHWLDVVHYADTHGFDKDKRRENAWPYRDYIIRSLNDDVPYGRFLREQVAGDVLYPERPDAIVATGFIAAGPWDFVGHVELREGTVEKEKTRVLDRDDMVANTISTFNSLTIHCARCHDHKFDPISQREYYSLQAVFAGLERGDRVYAGAGSPAERKVYAVIPRAPRPIAVLHRGDVEQRGEVVGPGALACAGDGTLVMSRPEQEGDRRAALAEWLARPENPLTWRSIVNRVWHYHFGRGLVDTPNDFGANGSTPSHPELLDWLAWTFRAPVAEGGCGESLKRLHRLMVLSAVYRQQSLHNERAARIDVENRLLWRMQRSRLDAESIRDAVLAVSGRLDRTMGGPGFALFRFKDDHSPVYDHLDPTRADDPATFRRTVYRFVVRSVPNPFLESLDCADPNLNTPVRGTTLTSLQALALLNDPFMVRQAAYFAERVRRESGSSRLEVQVRRAHLLALGREPDPESLAALSGHAAAHGLASTCRLLLNANAFHFVD